MPGDCNPLSSSGHCALPWPSSYFQVDDETTGSGKRNALPLAAMPKDVNGRKLRADPGNRLDGVSPVTPLLLFFPGGVDAGSLATQRDFTPSLAADAPVQLFDMSTGARVMYFAELDQNAAAEERTLIIRPQERLQPAHRYAVAVTLPVPVPPAFLEAREGKLQPGSALWTMKPRYDELFGFLEKQGLERAQLTLAWDFWTASEDAITGRMVRMRDKALAAATLDYRFERVTPDAGEHLDRELEGTFDVPSFLASDAVDAKLPADAGSDPAVQRVSRFPLVVHVPECARTATAPLPMMIYGHGLLGSAIGELNDDYQPGAIDRLCMVQVATNWIGLSADDRGTLIGKVLTNVNAFDILAQRLMQAQVNAVVLARLAKTKLHQDPALALNGRAVSDGSELYYQGISLGGIEGLTFMALTPDIERGVLNVGGGAWTLMMGRSSNFSALQVLLDAYLPDPVDQQLAIALTQSLWDETDPISYAPHVLNDPLPGVTKKRLLSQESIGDAQVPNLSTRLVARTAGLPGLGPLVQPVPGVSELPGPLDSAYVQFDAHPTALPPESNVPPQDNEAHEACRRLDVVQRQIGAFLKPAGRVEQVCVGTCDPD